MEVRNTYLSCMDPAYCKGNPTSKIAGYKVQDSSIYGYLKLLVKTSRYISTPKSRKPIPTIGAQTFRDLLDLPKQLSVGFGAPNLHRFQEKIVIS